MNRTKVIMDPEAQPKKKNLRKVKKTNFRSGKGEERLTEMQDKFCKAYAVHHNGGAAAREAGYAATTEYVMANTLLKNPVIVSKIEEYEKLGLAEQGELNVISEVQRQYKEAVDNNQTQNALKALELLAKITIKQEEPEPVSIEELEDDIIKQLEILGEPRAMDILKKLTWLKEESTEPEPIKKVEL